MTDVAYALGRLSQALAEPGLSPRTATRCRSLIEQLQRPVRLAIFGMPEAGQTAVLNALAGRDVLDTSASSASALVQFSERPEMAVTDSVGLGQPVPVTYPVHLSDEVLFAELGLPCAALKKMSLLLVAADTSREDQQAALIWAAPRCDIAVWCTRDWSEVEQSVWDGGPASLKHHALMTVCEVTKSVQSATRYSYGIEQNQCVIDLVDGDAGLTEATAEKLRQRVCAMIEDARSEDVHAALYVLEQLSPKPAPTGDRSAAPPEKPAAVCHDMGLGATPALAVPAPQDKPAALNEAERKDAGASAPQRDHPSASDVEMAHPLLSRIFLRLRDTAQDLYRHPPEDGYEAEGATDLLHRLDNLFETLVELADDEPEFNQFWPDLHETLLQARELSLLLKSEGQPQQALEATELLVRVRRDVELAIAA